jgi:Na+/citrate or Na+/malate symporter
LYVFGLIYLFIFAIIQVLFSANPSEMRLLDFLLAYLLYERIWHLDKKITFKKVLKTILWAIIGNIGILAAGLLIRLVLNLAF